MPLTQFSLLLTAREAANALSISERKLWSISTPRGDLPAARIGRRVLYSREDLQSWIEKQKEAVE